MIKSRSVIGNKNATCSWHISVNIEIYISLHTCVSVPPHTSSRACMTNLPSCVMLQRMCETSSVSLKVRELTGAL